MKKFAIVSILAIGAFLLVLIAYAPTAQAVPLFEDPQLCVDGKLFRADPTTSPIEVWVRVGNNLSVDFDVVNCGGDPDLPVVAADHVWTNGKKNTLEVAVLTDPKAKVQLYFDGKTKTEKADKHGWVYAKIKVK